MKIFSLVVILLLTLSLVSADEVTAPSVVSIGVSYGDETATLSVTTDESATCKFSKTNEDYANMANMPTTGDTDHSATETFAASQSGTYYILCQDEFDNLMSNPATTNYNMVIEVPEEVVEEQVDDVLLIGIKV